MSDTEGVPVPAEGPRRATAGKAPAEVYDELHRLCALAGKTPPALNIVANDLPTGSYDHVARRIALSTGALEDPDPNVWRMILAHEVGHMAERWWRLPKFCIFQTLRTVARITPVGSGLMILPVIKPEYFPVAVLRFVETKVIGSELLGAELPLWFVAFLTSVLLALAAESMSRKFERKAKHEIRADAFIVAAGHKPNKVAAFLRRISELHDLAVPDNELSERLRALGEPGRQVLARWLMDSAAAAAPRDGGPLK